MLDGRREERKTTGAGLTDRWTGRIECWQCVVIIAECLIMMMMMPSLHRLCLFLGAWLLKPDDGEYDENV